MYTVFYAERKIMSFITPELPYSHDALEPYIDKETMEIHHEKHHKTYVNKLNEALDKYPDFFQYDIEILLAKLNEIPEEIRTAVRNNGGGHFNHSLLWGWMSPTPDVTPTGKLSDAIDKTFGSLDMFKEEFTKAALNRFGSGWAWLVMDKNGNLSVTSTPNQDSPVMDGDTPVLGLDVWEHAYYLKYRNMRASYIENWWNVVNWKKLSLDFENL
ncbi:MAG: Superoxide dismutase [candidate division WWE3 bacterium GW2011_GWB1_41_6]|nr:MAG: Superoxide dismutase [candidate division WWE3 bacterium GW2011_GWB1_41_6]